ncbi:carboxymuconolactone decarboxylase family protein [bacterium]|nr:carboxymuconolactone decarboxylase family protein [bacterium]
MSNIFERIRNERGGVANIHSAFNDFPIGVEAHYNFYHEILLRDDLPLSRIDREFLAVATSQSNLCPYCISHHQSALDTHSKEEEIPSEQENLLREFAISLTKEPWKSKLYYKKFLESGYTKAQFQHATMIVSYFNLANRCAHALDLELEETFEETCK